MSIKADETVCPYVVGVDPHGKPSYGVSCDSFTHCQNCGWYPPVEKKRKEKIRERLGNEDVIYTGKT